MDYCPSTGKIQYDSASQARRSILMGRMKASRGGEAPKAYQCPHCDCYHVTRMDQSTFKKPNATRASNRP